MLVLALDTTTRAGSVALVSGERILLERVGDAARAHAERLPGDILQLLDDAAVPLSAVDRFAIAAGPGSFTGLRIGIATVQGLAFAGARRVTPVSALEALAQIGSADLPPAAIVGVWMDAYRREVFSGLYRATGAAQYSPARVAEIEGPAVDDPAATLARWQDHPPDCWIGDGAVLYAAAAGARGRVMAAPALAGAIGLMAAHPARAGEAVDPAGLQPLYIRRPDAEVARERSPVLRVLGGEKTLMPDWIIEPLASPAEIDAIQAIEDASFTNPWTREMYLAELENADVSFFVLARDGARRPVGFCAFWRVLDELHINNLAVLPAFRRQGVASALLRGVLAEGVRLRATSATLEVRRSNEAAQRLYERFGFSVAGVRSGYYTKPVEDALVLWRADISHAS